MDIAGLENIGIYGYYTGVERWWWASTNIAGSLSPDYFCNKKLEKPNWRYSPLKYWPIDPMYKISFFAYSPHTATTDASGTPLDLSGEMIAPYPATDSQRGLPTLRYRVPEDITEQVDLLWAAETDRDIEHTPVVFNMRHALTKITFAAQFADETEAAKGFKVAVTRISIDGVRGEGTFDLTSGSWSFAPGVTADKSFVVEGGDLRPGSVVQDNMDVRYWLSDDAGALMMIPQDLRGAALNFDLEYNNGYGDITRVPMTFDLDDYPPWRPGVAIEYKILARAGFITVNTTMTNWVTGTSTSTSIVL
jgi:hypothetical protein